MENLLSTVTWVAPLILTIIFSGLIPLLVHWHKISRNPIIKVSSHETGRGEKDYALVASLTLNELVGDKYSDWYKICIKNMDSSPLLVKRIRANKRVAKVKNLIYVMPGEEILIKLPQDLSVVENRVFIDSFTVDIRNKDARFRVKIGVSNPDTSANSDVPRQLFPKYELIKISYRPF